MEPNAELGLIVSLFFKIYFARWNTLINRSNQIKSNQIIKSINFKVHRAAAHVPHEALPALGLPLNQLRAEHAVDEQAAREALHVHL